jgi:hypothetical protein
MPLTEEMRGKRNPPLASRYWHHPDDCSHRYVLEYLTALTTSGYCRGCGALIQQVPGTTP